jgi:hypothetical protein
LVKKPSVSPRFTEKNNAVTGYSFATSVYAGIENLPSLYAQFGLSLRSDEIWAMRSVLRRSDELKESQGGCGGEST